MTTQKRRGPKKYQWSGILPFILLLLPTVLLMEVLVRLFPYTGLGRIVFIPSAILMNAMIILASMAIRTRAVWTRIVKIGVTLMLTVAITVGGYPQEFGPSVPVQIHHAIQAVRGYDDVTREDLNVDGYQDNPQYVVALYKFRNELLREGTYQLYQRENVYYRDYTIKELQEIPSQLMGYHKVIWWVLTWLKRG